MNAPGCPLVDTHAHLVSGRFESDLPEVLDRARAAGIVRIVSAGTTANDSARTVALARLHPRIHPAVAIHPNDVADSTPDDWPRIRALAAEPVVVAVGETGLDRHWDRTPLPVQVDSFARHLDLARERDLPIIIHCREAYPDVIGSLERMGGPVRGVLHSFTGTADDARALLALGLHLSFAGMITFANRNLDPLREVAAAMPIDRLLVETDSPYLAPHPHRGKRNEPSFVGLTAARVAEIRGLPMESLAASTTANAFALFRLPPD